MKEFFSLAGYSTAILLLLVLLGASQQQVITTAQDTEVIVIDSVASIDSTMIDSSAVIVDTVKKVEVLPIPAHYDREVDTFLNIEQAKKEWFPFNRKQFDYEWDSLLLPEKDIIHLTNILFRESGATVTSHHDEIDQYLVAIVAIRKYMRDFLNKESLEYQFRNGTIKYLGIFTPSSYGYTIPVFKHNKVVNEAAWYQCLKVVKNVIACKIPKRIPYIPHGTYSYLNSRIDTNEEWIGQVTKHWVVVASTCKDHFYYADPKHMTDIEVELLKKNPVCPKQTRFHSGLFATLYREANSLN